MSAPVLQCCANGARPSDVYPAVPMSPRHLARDARAVAALGIGSFHVHPRDRFGQETLDPGDIGAVVSGIRQAAPGMEVCVTTARWVEPDPRQRTEILGAWGALAPRARPDVASVNVHERGWELVCEALHRIGVGIELGVWTASDAVQLKQVGVPPGTVRVVAEVTVTDPQTAVAEAVRILNALGPQPVPILLHGEELGAWPVLEYAQRHGLDSRMGFEDTLRGPDGTWLATGNEELMRYALGRPVTPRLEVRRRPGRRPEHRR